MLSLDLRTISVILGLVSMFQAVIIGLYYRVSPRYHGLGHWALTSLANAAGFLLLLLRGNIPDVVSIVGGNGLLLAAIVWQLQGIHRFFGLRRPGQERFATGLVAATLLAFLPLIFLYPDLTARIVLFSGAETVLFLMCTWSLLRVPGGELRAGRWFSATVIGAHGLWFGFRTVLTAVLPPEQSVFSPTALQIITFLMSIAAAMLWTAGLVGMTIQRLVLELRRTQASERALLETAASEANRRADTARALLDVLVQRAPIGVGFLDGDLQLGMANQRLTRADGLLARHQAEPIGLGPQMTPSGTLVSLAQTVLKQGSPASLEVADPPNAPPNETQTWQVSAYPVPLDSQIVGVGVIAADVTADRRATAVLRNAKATLEAEVAERTADLVAANRIIREREQLFRLTFDRSPIGAALIGLDYCFERVNDTMCAITGYTEAELLRVDIPTLTHPDDAPRTLAQLRRLISGEIDSFTLEKRYLRKDGASVWAQSTVRLMHDADGRQLYGLVLVEDISARKAAEEALRGSRLQLEQALWGAELGFWDWHIPTGAMDANEQLAQLVGVSLAELTPLVERWIALVHPDDSARLQASFAAALEGRSAGVEAEYRIRHRDGSWRWQLVRGRAVEYGPAGEAVRLIGVTQDITERKQVEETLRERETMLRVISDNLPDAMIYQLARDPVGNETFTYVSAGVEQISGVTPEQAYAGAAVFDPLHDEGDRERYLAAVERSAQQLEIFEYEMKKRLPGGEIRWSHIRARPRPRPDGGIIWDGIEVDITPLKRAEEALRRRIDEMLALNQIAQALTTWTDLARGLHSVGPLLRQLFAAASVVVWEYQAEEARLRRYMLLDAPSAQRGEQTLALAATALGRQLIRQQSATIVAAATDDALLAGGAERTSMLLVPLRARNNPVGILCVRAAWPGHVYAPTDVALAQTIAGVLGSALENAHLFAQAQSVAAEGERRRLARDLHDSVSQALFAANRTAEVLPKIWELDPEEGQEALADLHMLTSGALAEMRALLVELRPRALAETPLHETLGYLASTAAAKRIAVDVALAPAPPLPPDVQVGLYRIVQEALNNIGKHAQARRAAVRLQLSPPLGEGQCWRGSLTLTVSDDGRGFDPAETRAGRMGLVSMRERATDIGAIIDIASQPGAGTQVCVVWQGAATEAERKQRD